MYSRLSLFRRGFTPLALALNNGSASSIRIHKSIIIRPFALSAVMRQIPSMTNSPELNRIQEIKPSFKNEFSAESPGTFCDKFIQALGEAELIVSVNGREILKDLLKDIPLMALTVTAQELLLKRLGKLPQKQRPEGIYYVEHTEWKNNNYITGDLLLPLRETKSFEVSENSEEPEDLDDVEERDLLYEIILTLVEAGLLLNSSVKSYTGNKVIASGTLDRIIYARFGAKGERGRISLDTGIITRIIEDPSEKFCPYLREVLQNNDVATLEGNIYEYVWSRKTTLSGWTPARARAALLERGVTVIPASGMNLQKATNRCQEVLQKMAKRKGLFDLVPGRNIYTVYHHLQKMNLDLLLIIQAHLLGRSLVTYDTKMLEEYESDFHYYGICAYSVEEGREIFPGMKF
ncbi:hypothetical protein BGX38DRAFT_1143762 [Terfezia claveryi]|nr:hypothetical protein BGX38DRAFT_1143762 [Terfezia claveryi]